MIDKCDNLNSQLIPSRNRSLGIIKSDLVKRGLEISNEIKKRHVRVVFGDLPDNIVVAYSEYYQNYFCSDRYAFHCNQFFRSDEIIEHSENEPVDIFILVVNNISYQKYPPVTGEFLDPKGLISLLKNQHNKPVIALTGYGGYPYIEARLVADFFFYLPFNISQLNYSISACLTKLNFDESINFNAYR